MHRVHLVLVGRGKWKVRDDAVERGVQASRWEMNQTCQNPSKVRQADGREVPQRTKQQFSLTAFVPKDPAAREKRVGLGALYWGGEEEEGGTGLRLSGALPMYLLEVSTDKNVGHCCLQLS